MDLELTAWQMLYMCLAPSLVCAPCASALALRATLTLPGCAATATQPITNVRLCSARHLRPLTAEPAHRTETKNQWARDDPAFVVITCGLVAVAAFAYCAT